MNRKTVYRIWTVAAFNTLLKRCSIGGIIITFVEKLYILMKHNQNLTSLARPINRPTFLIVCQESVHHSIDNK